MRKLKLLFASLALLVGSGTTWAQTDVTSTYITNPSFESDGAKSESTSSNNITGWTFAAFADKTVVGTSNGGTLGWITGVSATDGNCFVAIRHRWESNQRESNLTQTITIPKGKYTLSVDYQAYRNQDTSPSFLFSVNANGGALATASGVFEAKSNTTFNDAINKSMSLNFEAFTSENTIKFYVKAKQNIQVALDNVKLLYNGNYTSELASAIASAKILYARTNNSDLNTAITHAEGVLSGADNSVAYQTTIDNEVTDLKSAVSTAYASVTLLTGENVSFLLENPDFESGSAVTGGICTYDYDCTANNTQTSQMAAVEGWTIASNGNGRAAGVVSFGSDTFLGGTAYKPTSVTSPNEQYKALGIVAVWSATAQYKQNVTFPAGSYIVEIPVYNLVGGTVAFSKNLIGFVENGGTEHLATTTTYTPGEWKTERIVFELTEETSGYISVGYTAAGKGSGDMPHLLVDEIKVTYTSPIAAAYQKYQDALQAAKDAIANTDYVNVTGDEKTELQAEIDKTPTATKDGYNNAADALDAARETFIAAKTNYDANVAAKATDVPTLTYASAAKKTALQDLIDAPVTTATDAATNTDAITTALRAYYESNALAEGVSGTVDYTSAVSDANADTNTGWSNGIGTNTDQGYTDAAGDVASKYLDGGWSSTAGVNIDMTRSVEIPAGKYLLTVTARGATDLDTYTLSIGGETIDLPKNGNTGGVFNNGWNDVSVEFDADGTTQTLEVIANSTASQQWISINRFRLVQLELNSDAYASTTEDYSALNDAIDDAEAKTLGFEDGEYAPYANTEALKKLAAAKAIDQTAELTNLKTDVAAATTALTSATWAANDGDVEAVFNGNFSSDVEGDWGLTGWTRTNSWGQQQKDIDGSYTTAYYNQPGSLKYGDTGYYTMPLKANTIYTLTFSYRSHENNSNNGVTASVLNGKDGLAATAFEKNGSTTVWKTAKKVFKTGAAGNYVLTLANSGNTWMTNVSIVKGCTDTESVTVSSVGYKTYCSENDLDFTSVDGVKAYKATATDKKVTFTPVTTVPAGEGVLLKGAGTFDIPVAANLAKWAAADNVFEGVTSETEVDGPIFVLMNGTSGVGFYKATAAKFTVGANTAYLPESAAASRMFIGFDDEEEVTGIRELNSSANKGAIYNMNGVRVEKAKKGLYIQNGKKFVVK